MKNIQLNTHLESMKSMVADLLNAIDSNLSITNYEHPRRFIQTLDDAGVRGYLYHPYWIYSHLIL